MFSLHVGSNLKSLLDSGLTNVTRILKRTLSFFVFNKMESAPGSE